jgi:hypothetical protein
VLHASHFDRGVMEVGSSVLRIIVGVLLLAIYMGTPVILSMKYFARPLRWWRCFLIFAASYFLTIWIVLAVAVAGIYRNLNTINGVGTVVWMFAQGSIITRLARKSGFERKGRLGLGAACMLLLVAFSWIVIGVVFVIYAIVSKT